MVPVVLSYSGGCTSLRFQITMPISQWEGAMAGPGSRVWGTIAPSYLESRAFPYYNVYFIFKGRRDATLAPDYSCGPVATS